jgi:murein DD-endopeptidase MepM/ murein hydrolase activator NlpD
MFPLKDYNKISFGFGEIYPAGFGALTGKPHLGIDIICPKWERVLAPFDGTIVAKVNGNEGGKTIHFLDKYGHLNRFMHLEHFADGWGKIKEGDIIGFTGDSGLYGNTPHLHWDVSIDDKLVLDFKHFINPIIYLKNFMFKPNSIIHSHKDNEYYWVKSDGSLLFIPHDRLIQACLMAVATPTDESLKSQSTGNF